MGVKLNHTIVWCRDQQKSAEFYSAVLGLATPRRFGPFLVLDMENEVSLDFYQQEELFPQHYAFLVSEREFDEIFGRIRERGLEYWADPGRTLGGQVNRHDGGRGVYFRDPDTHLLEIITRPYGSGTS